jgi:hypothetical protein
MANNKRAATTKRTTTNASSRLQASSMPSAPPGKRTENSVDSDSASDCGTGSDDETTVPFSASYLGDISVGGGGGFPPGTLTETVRPAESIEISMKPQQNLTAFLNKLYKCESA